MSRSHKLQRRIGIGVLLLFAIVSINSIFAFLERREVIEKILAQVLSDRAGNSGEEIFFCIDSEARAFVPKQLLGGDLASRLPIAGTHAALLYEPMASNTSADEGNCYWTFVDRYLIFAVRLGVVRSTKARDLKMWHVWAVYLGNRWIVVSEKTVLY